MLKWFLALLAAMFIGALLAWWWGRVLLPEVGLNAPGYWTWFWASVPLCITTGLGAAIKELSAPATFARR